MTRTLHDWLRWQETLHGRAIDLGLNRVRCVAARLGLPSARPLTVTIGGTNGKGSSAHLAALIYREAGHRVGLYTSPHLLHYNERVRIDGVDVDDQSLCRAFEAIERVRADTPLTYFEYGTLAALWLFAAAEVDVQVLEVGLGGRLDAVNLVDADAALVTNIGLDHTDWLGPDRDSIGREKAGIFRAGRPAIIADPDPPAGLLDAAAATGAVLRRIGVDFGCTANAQGFDWWTAQRRLGGLPAPGLRGPAQLRNAAGVIALVDALQQRCRVDEAAIRRALPRLYLPGRCESRGRYLLDVAHNREAAEVLADHLRAQGAAAPRVLVLGMLADKPHAAFVDALAGCFDALILVELPPPRGMSAKALAAAIGPRHVALQCCENMAAALAAARARAGDGRIVVTGSFLTVAAAAALIDSEDPR
ncbi:bifunctional tetrahydrofolate synthase/dihydrofolate synthase [Sinimarinibacterium thermocellulolyticum]|uniref:Dihydrofolate synthase/folylpolyglutamate synthase n=1 Tax=Sinimarinibacterium thermocellulolyticum TaxID=3170016 RepID=A0ABV2ABD3_9GAMM